MAAGKSSDKDAEKKRNHQHGLSRKYARLVRKWRSEEVGRLGIVQEILRKSTDFLRRIIAPVGGRGGVTLSYICPHCNSFPLEDKIWWVSTDMETTERRRCAVCGGKYERSAPNRILVVQLGTNEDEAKVFRAHAVPQGLCENLINALKLLANQQRDGDSPIQNIVTGLRERSRESIMNSWKSFIDLDNCCRGGGPPAQGPAALQGHETRKNK